MKPVHMAEYYNLSPYHISNLETLRDFLRSDNIPPPVFDITNYVTRKSISKIVLRADVMTDGIYSECGTSACAVGHGPLAGIPALPMEAWHEYERRVFGVTQYHNNTVWQFLFSSGWASSPVNNTAKASAAPIDWFLKHGVPRYSYYSDLEFPHVWLEGLDLTANQV